LEEADTFIGAINLAIRLSAHYSVTEGLPVGVHTLAMESNQRWAGILVVGVVGHFHLLSFNTFFADVPRV
jgi:hypothetical protein